jgi:rhodanese-related sulfurtransferase
VATTIDTVDARRLLQDNAQVIEVLSPHDYDVEHLPGALNIPLGQLSESSVRELDRALPTIVYGFDYQCDRGTRAAHHLEELGFSDVYDYAPGKSAWLAEGLASDGSRTADQRVSSIADPDVPVVPADATVADLGSLGPKDVGIVLDEEGVVLGIVRPEVMGLDRSTPVRDVLQPGPSTFRPSMTLREMADYFRTSDEARAIISTLEGRWIGLIRRTDVLDG